MKVTFTFVNLRDLSSATRYDLWRTHFDFPDEALTLPDYRERLETIAELAGRLTQVSMYVTCAELDWKMKQIYSWRGVSSSPWITAVLGFEARRGSYPPIGKYLKKKYLKILYASSPFDGRSLGGDRLQVRIMTFNDEQQQCYLVVNQLADQCLTLLNTDPEWRSRYLGFHPSWPDNAIGARFNKRVTARIKAQKREERAKKRQEARAEKAARPKTEYVYFIQQGSDGPIKIGHSVDSEKRLRALKTASPHSLILLKMVEGSQKLERDIHTRFAEVQLDGEWFHPAQTLLDYIDSLE